MIDRGPALQAAVRATVLATCIAGVASCTVPATTADRPDRPDRHCTSDKLSLRMSGNSDAFDGMSHGGVGLLIRNDARTACLLSALPPIVFKNADGGVVPTRRRVPPGLHPGPVMVPVRLPPGGTASLTLRWVSGDVYDGHHCIAPRTLGLGLPGDAPGVAFVGHLCAPAGTDAFYEQTPLMMVGQGDP